MHNQKILLLNCIYVYFYKLLNFSAVIVVGNGIGDPSLNPK